MPAMWENTHETTGTVPLANVHFPPNHDSRNPNGAGQNTTSCSGREWPRHTWPLFISDAPDQMFCDWPCLALTAILVTEDTRGCFSDQHYLVELQKTLHGTEGKESDGVFSEDVSKQHRQTLNCFVCSLISFTLLLLWMNLFSPLFLTLAHFL